jgi:uncharacterized protein YndB with AHSA1/START domain
MSNHGVLVSRDTIQFERLLPGPIERVWSYLTESEKRGTWFSSGAMDLRVGGRVEHVFRNSDLTTHNDPVPAKYEKYAEARMEGRIIACEPPRLISYTWPEGPGGASEVTFELTAKGDNVLLVLTHRRLATRKDVLGVAGGWHTHLDFLADRLNGREPATGFWAAHERIESEYEPLIPAEDPSGDDAR